MGSKELLENCIPMSELQIEPQFQFDLTYRNKFDRISEESLYTSIAPFTKTLQSFIKVSKSESPMSKLELIYNCCTVEVTKEISQFWQCHNIPQKKLSIDTDQLQGILIYIISRLNYPQILTEVIVCERFLPAAVKKSSRFLYLEMIKAACNYLLEKDFKKNETQIKESIVDNWDGLQFGQSIGKDNFLENIERSSSFEVDSKPELYIDRKTHTVELQESDSPLFMKERHNSFEESPDIHKEGTDHFQNIGPIPSKKKPKLA